MLKVTIQFNRSGYLDAQGLGQVSVRVHEATQGSINYKIPVKVHALNWDRKTRRVKPSDPDYVNKNIIIHAEESKFIALQARMSIEGRTATLDDVRNFIDGSKPQGFDFIDYYKKNIGKSRISNDLSLDTINARRSTLDKLTLFKKRISFNDVNSTFIEAFKAHRQKIGDAPNTVQKHLKHIKSMVIMAKYDGFISDRMKDDPFKSTRMGRMKAGKKFALNFEQFEKIKNLNYTKDDGILYHVWKEFMFACRTSFRVSDVFDLRYKHITDTENGKVLIKKSVKSSGGVYKINFDTISEFFKDNLAEEILNEYWQEDHKPEHKIFPKVTMTYKLRQIADDIGLDGDPLTFHIARHTCATQLAALNVGMHKIMRIGGWEDARTVRGYIDLADEMLGRV